MPSPKMLPETLNFTIYTLPVSDIEAFSLSARKLLTVVMRDCYNAAK